MHEAHLARDILGAILSRLPPGEALRIQRVYGTVAETESLSAQSLGLHFAAVARGGPAEGADLELKLVHVEARCNACGGVYAPEHHLTLCPACGSTDGTVLGQTGLFIDRIDVGP